MSKIQPCSIFVNSLFKQNHNFWRENWNYPGKTWHLNIIKNHWILNFYENWIFLDIIWDFRTVWFTYRKTKLGNPSLLLIKTLQHHLLDIIFSGRKCCSRSFSPFLWSSIWKDISHKVVSLVETITIIIITITKMSMMSVLIFLVTTAKKQMFF